MSNHYGIKPGYNSRPAPTYFEDALPDSTAWQADVYRLAALLAQQVGATRLVDIGCGRGGKLTPYAEQLAIVGLDHGSNIEHCLQSQLPGEWYSVDLNREVVISSVFRDSVVICADVIEHLPTPDALMETLRNAADAASYVLVSTPDRLRVYGHDHNGPSGNPFHVREWTHNELETWFLAEQLPIRWSGWTVSNDTRPDQVWTSLIILSKTERVGEMPLSFEPALHWRTTIEVQA